MKRYITHVRKDSEDRIIAVKTRQLILKTLEVVQKINSKEESFYVFVNNSEISVGVYKEKWIRTYSDGKWTNNLNNLPRF